MGVSTAAIPTDWREELESSIAHREKLPVLERPSLQSIFKEIGNNYGIRWTQVQSYYYGARKKSIQEKAESMQQSQLLTFPASTETQESKDNVKTKDTDSDEIKPNVPEEVKKLVDDINRTYEVLEKPKKPMYKRGDQLEVRVIGFQSYGIFVETTDEYRQKGLVHLKEIASLYVHDPTEYWEEGDLMQVKVLHNEGAGRLAFTRKGFTLPPKKERKEPKQEEVPLEYRTAPKNPILAEKLKQLDIASALTAQTDEQKQQEPSQSNNSTASTVHKEEQPDKEVHHEAINDIQEEQVKTIIGALNKLIGIVTPQSEEKLRDMLKHHDMFKVGWNMALVGQEFVADYGLIFLGMVEEKLKEGL